MRQCLQIPLHPINHIGGNIMKARFGIHNLLVEKITPLMETVCGRCSRCRCHTALRELATLQDQAEAASSKAGGVKPRACLAS